MRVENFGEASRRVIKRVGNVGEASRRVSSPRRVRELLAEPRRVTDHYLRRTLAGNQKVAAHMKNRFG